MKRKLILFLFIILLINLFSQDYSSMEITNSTTDLIPGTLTASTWQQITGYTETLSDGASFSSNTITTQNDATTRRYLISYDLSFKGTPGLWQVGISIDDADPTKPIKRRISSSSDTGNIGGYCFLEIAHNSTISLKAKCDVDATLLETNFSHLSIVEVGQSDNSSYASMTIIEASASQSGINSFTKITGFSEGTLKDWTFSDNSLIAGAAAVGTYLVLGSVSFNGRNDIDYELGIGYNNNDPYGEGNSSNIGAKRHIGSNNDVGNCGFSGIITISENDIIDLQAQSTNAIDFKYANITLIKISGTTSNGYTSMEIGNNSNTMTIGSDVTKITQYSNSLTNSELWNFNSSALEPINLAAGIYLVNYFVSIEVPIGASNSTFDTDISVYKNSIKQGNLTTERTLEKKTSGNTDIGAISGVGLIEITAPEDIIEIYIDNVQSQNSRDVIIYSSCLSLTRLRLLNEGTLPVELSAFTAIPQNDGSVAINWTTQSETNVSGFKVYSSLNSNLENAHNLNPELIPATNTTNTENYTYIDESPLNQNIVYYWLESIDLDGTSEFYGPIIANFNGNMVQVDSYGINSLDYTKTEINWSVSYLDNSIQYFEVYRNENLSLEDAEKINQEHIYIENNFNGNYSFIDETAEIGKNYNYWVTANNWDEIVYIFEPKNFILPNIVNSELSSKIVKDKLIFSWETEFESDMEKFELLKSTSNSIYDANVIAEVAAKNNAASYEIELSANQGEAATYWLQSTTMHNRTYISEQYNLEIPYLSYLIGNYPNPFTINSRREIATTIEFSIANPKNAKLEIFNILGQKVKSFPIYQQGLQKIYWNGKDENNLLITTGVYFYQLSSNNKVIQSKKMLLMK